MFERAADLDREIGQAKHDLDAARHVGEDLARSRSATERSLA
jgi:hypothetical protein